MHWDLKHLSLKQAENHFIFHGVGEGRKYKPSQNNNPPAYIKEYIKKHNLLFLNN